ncbi:MAG: 50S ribosomal protein L29 [Porticoccaceae bacterium]|nr:50S ribosomal protein L29 [Porticoccaceae bacterium]
MKSSDLSKLSADELQAALLEQRERQFKLRMQKATGQLNGDHEVKQARRNIARIKTVLSSIKNEKAGN